MPMIETPDGVSLYVKTWGTGRPVVLLHGWPLSADSFDDLALALAEAGHKAIAYDRRGFGRSDQPWSGYDYDTLSDDLAAVIEATEAGDATLVGFSMGGGEVARYMSRHGGRNVERCALIASIVPYMLKTESNPDGVPQSTFDTMEAAIREDRAAFFDDFFNDFYGVGYVTSPVSHQVLRWSRYVALQAGLHPTIACLEAFSSTDFRGDLSSFGRPTLILHGADDATVPIDASARQAARGIPNSKLVEISGGPHGLLASHKERVAAELLDFLKS
jgi:non-heme chloroperoxidase